MVIVYLFASLLGALGTVVALSSSSWLMALLCAPLGGSALTLIVAAVVAVRVSVSETEREPSRPAPLASPAP